ncbi:MAG: hypothetical protein WCR19_05425 [Acholeplasmataceae bacterium]
MIDFFKKFFEYANYDGVIRQFEDNLGHGAYQDYRHFLWMVVTIILVIIVFKVFKTKQQFGYKVMMTASIGLFSVRFINQVMRAIIGAEVPALRAFPFHLCTVMTFLLPIVIVFNIKKLKPAVFLLSMMGGIITILIGDYFDNKFMTFGMLEGMTAHTLLILIPCINMAIGGFKMTFKKSLTVFPAMMVLLLWATFANEVLFKAYDTNYMYLRRNGLPGNLGGNYYLLIYGAIFLLLYGLIVGLPYLFQYKKYQIAEKHA